MNASRLLLGSALLLSTLAVACGDASETAPATSTANIDAEPGLVLRGRGADRDLGIRIGFEMRDASSGSQAALKRITVERGTRKFSSYCSTSGRVDATGAIARLACTAYTSSVDSRESLRFTVVETNDVFAIRDVKLTGTKLAKERAALVGAHGDESFEIDAISGSSDRRVNPFVAVRDANAVLKTLLGKEVYLESLEKLVPAQAFEHSVSEHFDVMGRVEVADTTYGGSFTFTMVEDRFDAASPFVSASELAKRAVDALPRPPQCHEPNVTPANAGEHVSSALSPLGGPSFGRAKEVTLDQVPAAVRVTLEKEGERIAKTTFAGTNYTAEVYGYYAVFASCTDSTVVAYAVWGGGSGEPDYHDGTVIGVDLDGNVVSDESDSG